nr:hypothetical protein [Tanacetum cinerariifolium]
VDVAPLVLKLRKNRTTHTDYIRHTQEEAATLKKIVERTKLVAVTPKNKTKQIRLTEQITKSGKTTVITPPSANIESNTPVLSSTGVTLVSSASGSMSQDNTKKNRIRQTQRKAKKNKLEDHFRTVKSSLNKKSVVDSKATSPVINFVSNVNSDLKCASCNGCLFSNNHDACVVAYIKSVNASIKSKSVKTPVKRKFGNPQETIATPTIVPPKEPIPIVNSTDTPVVTLVYSRKTKASNKKVPNKMEPNYSWGSSSSNVPSSLIACRFSKSSFVKFGNDHVAKIMGYGDYQIGNVTISRVYYVEGLGHNLFSVGQFCDSDLEVAFRQQTCFIRNLDRVDLLTGQFCDSDLEVAFRQHTCFIRNLDGVDLLTGSRGNNLYTLSLQDMIASSPICLLSKASKTKSRLWHRRLSHLNFGAINYLARQGLVRGLPKLKFEKDHLCSACAMGKSTKKTHKPKSEDTNQEKLYLHHMDLCGPMRVESVNGKKYIFRLWQLPVLLKIDPLFAFDMEIHLMSFCTVNFLTYHFHVFGALCYPTNNSENLAVEVIASIADVIPPIHADSTGSPSSTTVDQDAPSPSKSHTTTEIQSSVIPQDVEDDNLDMEVAHMGNDLLFGVPIPEVTYAQSSSTASPQSIVHTNHPIPHHNSKWTKDHPLNNIIGQISRPVSTRLKLHEQALFCYYDSFLTSVEPKTYKDALTQSCWIEAMQEELNEFER